MNFHEGLIPVIAMTLGISGIGLPCTLFSVARKWSLEQPSLSAHILGGAIAISILSVLGGVLIILVILGWMPSPREFL